MASWNRNLLCTIFFVRHDIREQTTTIATTYLDPFVQQSPLGDLEFIISRSKSKNRAVRNRWTTAFALHKHNEIVIIRQGALIGTPGRQ